MRVRYHPKNNSASMLKHYQAGHGLHVAHMHYGAGLGAALSVYALHNLVTPAGKGATRGAVAGGLNNKGSFGQKVSAAGRGARAGAVQGVLKGRGIKKRPY